MKNIKKTIVDKAWTNIVRIENLFCNIYDMLPTCAGDALHDFVTSSTRDDGDIIASCYHIDMSKENVKCAFYELLEDAAEKYRKEHDYANVEKLMLPDEVHAALLKFPTNKIFLIIFNYHSYIEDRTFKYIDGIFEKEEEAEKEKLRLINEYENMNESNMLILVTEKEKLNEFLDKNEKNELMPLEKSHNNRMIMKFLKKQEDIRKEEVT